MAKVTFVYPAFESLGIGYLSACLKSAGHKTFLVYDPVIFNDTTIDIPSLSKLFSYRDKVVKSIVNSRPDLVAFSCVTEDYGWACAIARKIKEISHVPIIFGGIHPTSVPEAVINEPFVDYLCVGEGEGALLDLANALDAKSDTTNINNLWVKLDKGIKINPSRPLIQDLDILPFSDKDIFRDVAPNLRYGYIISASRGCLYSCSYCCHDILMGIYKEQHYFRSRSVENIIKELILAKDKYKIKTVAFCDSLINFNREWLIHFLKEYIKQIKLPFDCYVHPKGIDEDSVMLMKAAGCHHVRLGVQTTNEKTRKDIFTRYHSNEDVASAIKLFRQYSIFIECDNIFGLPNQSVNDIFEMAQFYNENLPSKIQVLGLRYYPKTKILDILRKLNCFDTSSLNSLALPSRKTRPMPSGGDACLKDFSKVKLFFSLLVFLPKKIRALAIQKRIFNYLPIGNTYVLNLLYEFFVRPKISVFITRTYRRYLIFIPKRFINLALFFSRVPNLYFYVIIISCFSVKPAYGYTDAGISGIIFQIGYIIFYIIIASFYSCLKPFKNFLMLIIKKLRKK